MKKPPLKFRLNVIGMGLIIFLAVRNYIPLFAQKAGLDKNFRLWIVVCIFTLVLSCLLPVIFIEKIGDFHPVVFGRKSYSLESPAILAFSMLTFVLMGVANSLVLAVLAKLGIVFPARALQPASGVFQLVLYFISVVLVPAICEELFVRGIVMNFLLPYGRRFAVISSAFLFMMMHTQVQSFIPVFGAGVVLACVYLYTDNIFMAMALHFLNNGYSFVMMYLQKSGGVSSTARGVMVIAAVITCGLAGGLYLKSKKVSLFGVLDKKEKNGRYSAFLKAPVMVLALLCCLMVIGSRLYVDLVL